MSEFSITPAERAGIEKAAQWHEAEQAHWNAVYLDHKRRGYDPGGPAMIMGWHCSAAYRLRALLEPRSSAPERLDPATGEPFDYFDTDTGRMYTSGGENK